MIKPYKELVGMYSWDPGCLGDTLACFPVYYYQRRIQTGALRVTDPRAGPDVTTILLLVSLQSQQGRIERRKPAETAQ